MQTNELEQFLETPSTDDVAVTSDAPASAEAKTDTNPDEGKGTNTNAEMPAAVKDESTAQPGAKHWAESAYHDEKRKRQEAERRIAEIEKSQKPAQEERPDLFVDPEGFVRGVDEKIQKTVLQDRISMSREFMLELKPDYTEKEARFIDMVKADPSLLAKMNASAMPAKFAYQTAAKAIADEAKQKLLDEVGDLDALREKIRQEELAKLQAPAANEKPAKPHVEKAPSLATASAAATNTSVTTPSLEELLDGR